MTFNCHEDVALSITDTSAFSHITSHIYSFQTLANESPVHRTCALHKSFSFKLGFELQALDEAIIRCSHSLKDLTVECSQALQ